MNKILQDIEIKWEIMVTLNVVSLFQWSNIIYNKIPKQIDVLIAS